MAQNPYQAITADILTQLNNNIVPWHKCWNSVFPLSYKSRKPYSALNSLLLGNQGGEYLTFKQALDAGGNVRKGAHGKIVFFFASLDVCEKDQNGQKIIDAETGKPVKVTVPFLKQYLVFSIADCENVKSKLTEGENRLYEISDCQEIIDNYTVLAGLDIEHIAGAEPTYQRDRDMVIMPDKAAFSLPLEYYHTVFKQLIRSTAAENRLDRKDNPVVEELAAELGASMLLSISGHDDPAIYDNSAAYINKWRNYIQNDTRLIVRASSIAEKAVKHIMRFTKQPNAA